ncbi:hypothetical protein BDV35DRAFT_3065 [Aspergillus flavus]|uniref:Uncharacterized protein n=1 Tax=Aspergillus flavus TaxID=5059 RepID=A0A5N6HKT1_ASPFL|nr:hypothetical protein BDV35DRAFT_3065 [Aspergillus flavus]
MPSSLSFPSFEYSSSLLLSTHLYRVSIHCPHPLLFQFFLPLLSPSGSYGVLLSRIFYCLLFYFIFYFLHLCLPSYGRVNHSILPIACFHPPPLCIILSPSRLILQPEAPHSTNSSAPGPPELLLPKERAQRLERRKEILI